MHFAKSKEIVTVKLHWMVQLCRNIDTSTVSVIHHAIQIQAKVSHVVICMCPPISVLYLQFQYVLPRIIFVHF